MKTVQVREAKSTLSALIEAAEQGRPTTITRHGKAAAVLVSVEAANRLYAKEQISFGDFLLSFPGGDEVERIDGLMRDIDL